MVNEEVTIVPRIAMWSVLLSLLSGCAGKPEPAAPPTAPGASIAMTYPVMLAGDRRLFVYDDLERLTTTSVSSGMGYQEFVYIDSAGMEYAATGVTDFGRKAVWHDMGTSQYRVFLQMKTKGKIGLEKAKALALKSATEPEEMVSGQYKANAVRRITGAKSFAELIEVCRDPTSDR